MEYNPLLYGRDPEENIVGVHMQQDDTVRVYTRHDQNNVTHRDERFIPFTFVTDEGLVAVSEDIISFKEHSLKGDLPYNHLLTFDSWKDHWDVVNALRKTEGLEDEVYYVASPQVQYLMQTGKTLYKGMTLDSVKRMQLDIETYSSTGSFPQARREGDYIFIVVLSDNFGFEQVLYVDNGKTSPRKNGLSFESEKDLLYGLIREIHRHDPDVIEMHNGLAFDLPYILERCEMYGMDFSIGRSNKPPRTWSGQKKFAERDIDYTNANVDGRSLIDTMFLAAAYDVFTRELSGYGLKSVSDHFRKGDGITYEEMHGKPRTYVAGDQITPMWDDDPDTILEYALDDVRETRYLADKLAGATFYLTQMLPMTYQEAHLSGTGKIIENIMVRQYLTMMSSLPQPQTGQQKHGGYTDIFYRGRFRNIVYADVASLYPSIMLKYRCHPQSDTLGVHRSMLEQLTDLRLKVKAEANQAKKEDRASEAAVLKATEQSYKVVINSAYGVMGDKWSLFNDFDEADRVAFSGQGLLKRMIEIIEYLGGTVIECDTDGVLLVAPESMHGDLDAQKELVEEISRRMPEGINVDMDGLFDVMVSYKKKNYALRDYKGKVKTKGGAFKNRGIERFGREYQEKMLSAFMDGDVAKMRQIHEDTKAMIVARNWTVEDFETKKNLKESMLVYQDKVEEGRNRAAQYEIAERLAEESGRRPMKGDTIRYYIAGSKKAYKVRGFVDARASEKWTKGSENLFFYLKRLDKFADRFRPYFTKEDAKMVFSKDIEPPNALSLFETPTVDLSHVEIVTTKVA